MARLAVLLINILFLFAVLPSDSLADVVACRLDPVDDVRSRQVEEKGSYLSVTN